MIGVVALCRDAVVAPAQAARTALQLEAQPALVWLFSWAVLAQVVSYGVRDGLALGAAAGVVGGFGGAALGILIGGAVVHLSAGLLGGQARAGAALRLLALTFVPDIFLPPFALAGPQAFLLARVVVFVWQLRLLLVGVREAYGLDTGTAALALLLPVGALLVALPLLALVMLGLGVAALAL